MSECIEINGKYYATVEAMGKKGILVPIENKAEVEAYAKEHPEYEVLDVYSKGEGAK